VFYHRHISFRFRLRECNLLVCTPMLEEGVELPRCNLIIRFDPPSSFRAMVQSRGRARVTNAHYITLVEEKDTQHFVNKWAQSLSMEKVGTVIKTNFLNQTK
jgi:ERCC4-related helicase